MILTSTLELGKCMELAEIYAELAKVDNELSGLMRAQPEFEEIYCLEMAEQPGEIVYLPRRPTEEDRARAEALVREREIDERRFRQTD